MSLDRSSADGQATAELAMVLPVLVLLLLGVAQVSTVAKDYVIIHHAVRESARQAALNPTLQTAADAAVTSAPGLDHNRLQAELDGGRSTGELLTVRLRYRSPTVVPVVGAALGDVLLNATAVVRVE